MTVIHVDDGKSGSKKSDTHLHLILMSRSPWLRHADVVVTMALLPIGTGAEHGNPRRPSHYDGRHRGGRIIVDANHHAEPALLLKLRVGNRDQSAGMAEICGSRA